MADALKEYLRLRDVLKAEKAKFEERLGAIQEVLAGEAVGLQRPSAKAKPGKRPGRKPVRKAAAVPTFKAPVKPPKAKSKTAPKGKPGAGKGRGDNPMSLREAVLQVTAKQALTKKEILAEVVKLGYRFAAKDPITSLNPVLYRSGQFKGAGGKWQAA